MNIELNVTLTIKNTSYFHLKGKIKDILFEKIMQKPVSGKLWWALLPLMGEASGFPNLRLNYLTNSELCHLFLFLQKSFDNFF